MLIAVGDWPSQGLHWFSCPRRLSALEVNIMNGGAKSGLV